MRKTLAIGMLIVLCTGTSAFAAKRTHHQISPKTQAATPKLTYRCYTNQPNCSGMATFGPQNQPISYRILYASGGQSNFVLYHAGETAQYSVRYNDLFQAAWGTAGVPNNAAKWFIGVN